MTSITEPAPFFSRSGSLFLPQPHAHSPWSTDMLHGRLLGGLLARAVEIEHGDPELQFARLTVDLFRNTGMVPVRVETGVVRQGRRIKVVDATAYADDQPVARASAVMLRRGEQPNGQVPSTPPWDMPAPDALGPAPESPLPFDVWYVDESGNPAKDLRIAGKRRAWARERHNLVDDEPMSPFVRAAMAGDFASPLANYSTTGLEFINSDYTLTLSRLPVGDLIGFESSGHISDAGVAVAECTVHDLNGPVGFCSVTAVATRPMQ